DNLQVHIDAELRLEEPGQLSYSHAVPYGDAVKADETLFAVIEHRARNVHAINRVRAVENEETNAVVGGCLHRVTHRRDVGIEAGADVLDIEHDCVDTLEHVARRSTHLAIQTEHRDAGATIDAVGDEFGIEIALVPVLGTEDAREFDVLRFVQQAGGTPPVAVPSGVIADQGDTLPRKRCETVAYKNIDAGHHNGFATAGGHGNKAEKKRGESAA